MAIRTTFAAKNAILDTGFDALFNGAILEIRSGPQPTSAREAPTGILLWSETLPADAFAPASNGVKVKSGTWAANGVANGTAGWFRFKLPSDTGAVVETQARLDGNISLAGGGGNMILPTLTIAIGQLLTITSVSVSI